MLNIFKSIFSEKQTISSSSKVIDIKKLLNAKNPKEINESIIAMDNHICELCEWGGNISKLTNAQKVFFYNQELEREINNGGFLQFYLNSSGDYAEDVINSLNLIGAHMTANIVKKANEQFPNGRVPKDRDKRQQVISQIEKHAEKIWEKLDEEFLKYDEDLNLLNFTFVRKRSEDFM